MLKYILLLSLFFFLFYYSSHNSIKKNIVIDAFTYFQESFMLTIRLSRMNEYVDYFLIVTSNITHSGLPLQINFSPFETFIQQYRNKIIFYNISFPPNCTESWCKESYQRIGICDGIKLLNPSNDSIVIVSDLDEIPTSAAMKYIIKNPPNSFYMLNGYMYYYNYRNKLRESWPGVVIVKASNCNKKIQKYRDRRISFSRTNSIPIYPSQTHCSYCYKNISSIQQKLHSFAHTEFNKPPYINREYIIDCVKKHISLFDESKFILIDYDKKILPLPNDKRFDYLKEEYGII